MGTAEFPDLGNYCTVKDCRPVDFLTFYYDRSKQIYKPCTSSLFYALFQRNIVPQIRNQDVDGVCFDFFEVEEADADTGRDCPLLGTRG